ncbi:hypothetical protein [Vibrio parahaemolyticus]|uniref:hypothetical protein n=1 Tax=Vibrio parahaemolyticus TaxID=670 RepID=UPI00226A5A8F|nr:hypothetical protein [Vibrio parahaemolyticus]MCX8905305.1 hypothetical protein [Vibrio parahaemolyticus]
MFGFFKRKAFKVLALIEEYDFLDVACYRAINVPEYLDCTSSPNAVFGYAKRAIDRVDFKGLV